MRAFKAFFFWIILLMAVAMSGYATYEVLTELVGTNHWIALGAAIAVDAAVIWLGTHSVELAKLGDDITKIRWITWGVILASLGINFLHGYDSGSWTGGAVAMIYPLLAAILYEFFIEHKNREALKERGRVLPEKPVFPMSLERRYKRELKQEWKYLARDKARDRLEQQRAELGTWRVQATILEPEPETLQVTAGNNEEQLENTEEQAGNTVPSWVPEPGTQMGPTEFAKLCVANGVTDLKTAWELAGTFSGTIKEQSLKTSLGRVKTVTA